jgi:hypothetical protein
MGRPFEIRFDENHFIQQLFIGGSVLAYVAVIFNIIVFVVLCRKNLISPATILMQGLAVADGLTSFCAYGLEPLFLANYKPVNFISQSDLVELKYPYCAIYVYLRYLGDDFHLVSLLLTTCIGVQKCIALRFPIWTKFHLSNRKSLVVCLACFVLSMAINIPRHFGIHVYQGNIQFFSSQCSVEAGPLMSYGLVYHSVITIIFIMLLCLLMSLCTGYIIYRLITNTFQGRQTEKRKQERRSIIMIILVLVVFFISEIPRMLINCVMFEDVVDILESSKWEIEHLITYIMDERFRLAAYLHIGADIEFGIAFYMVECMKLFTLLGCISNFIIYLCTSQKMRNEIRTIFKCTNQHRQQK